jgi:hypothetical protein
MYRAGTIALHAWKSMLLVSVEKRYIVPSYGRILYLPYPGRRIREQRYDGQSTRYPSSARETTIQVRDQLLPFIA